MFLNNFVDPGWETLKYGQKILCRKVPSLWLVHFTKNAFFQNSEEVLSCIPRSSTDYLPYIILHGMTCIISELCGSPQVHPKHHVRVQLGRGWSLHHCRIDHDHWNSQAQPLGNINFWRRYAPHDSGSGSEKQ